VAGAGFSILILIRDLHPKAKLIALPGETEFQQQAKTKLVLR
jgi:hypothetical protein